MKQLQDVPLKQKLIVIALVTTGTALLLAGVGNVIVDNLLYRAYLQRDVTVLARVIADNSTAALAFNDPKAGAQILSALRARPHVTAACMYTFGGDQAPAFATYSTARDFACLGRGNRGVPEGWETVTERVMLEDKEIGTLVLHYDLGELGDRVRLYGSIIFLVFLLASMAGVLLSLRLQRAVVTPVSELVAATTAVSETGNYGIRAEKHSQDELGVLVDRFNEMLSRVESTDTGLRKALQDVETERERFEFMAESMPQKIFTSGPDGEVDYLNSQWMEFTGQTFEQMKGWGWTQFVHSEDLDESLTLWKRALESGDPFTCQQRFRRADGQYRWHLSRARAMRRRNGEISMWIGSNTDIHEQKETEQGLRRANEDLQQFAYSASHDLQEPIRNVAIYSDIIARRYEHALDEDGRQFLSFLREGGSRLSVLVRDLLAYTRASMAELSEREASGEAALKNAMETLADRIRASSAEIIAGQLPTVRMGELHLQQVLQNLISNAIKYASSEPPKIEVAAFSMGRTSCITVKDNGIGIDPRYKEKIFGVFKRLSHDQKYSGTGIGLAICQRIVERYGGTIWVESELGKGATFYFTVPEHNSTAWSAAAGAPRR